MAAAHENLPHLQPLHHMVSNSDAGGDEGWEHILALDDACAPPEEGVFFPGKPLPTVMHYCQTYKLGDFGFAKRRIQKSIFTCEHGMLLDPASELKPTDYIFANNVVFELFTTF